MNRQHQLDRVEYDDNHATVHIVTTDGVRIMLNPDDTNRLVHNLRQWGFGCSDEEFRNIVADREAEPEVNMAVAAMKEHIADLRRLLFDGIAIHDPPPPPPDIRLFEGAA